MSWRKINLLICAFITFHLCFYSASQPCPTTLLENANNPRQQFEKLIANRPEDNSFDWIVKFSEEMSPSSTAYPPTDQPLQFLIQPPTDLVVAANDRLELICEVSGSPPPVIRWLKNGQLIVGSSYREDSVDLIIETESLMPIHGRASTKSRLIIDCVDQSSEAIYICEAELSEEREARSTYVHVEGEIPYEDSTCSAIEPETSSSVFMWSGTYIQMKHGRPGLK